MKIERDAFGIVREVCEAYYLGVPGRSIYAGIERPAEGDIAVALEGLSKGMEKPLPFLVEDGSGWLDENGQSDTHWHIAAADTAAMSAADIERLRRCRGFVELC